MSSVEVSKLSAQEISQLACTYASLILYDDGQDVTADKISTLVKAAGVKVESYWPKMFAKAVSGTSISSFFNFGTASAGSAPAAKEVAKQTKKEQPKKDDKKAPAKKEQPKPVEDDEADMGGLFD